MHKPTARILPYGLGAGIFFWGVLYLVWHPHPFHRGPPPQAWPHHDHPTKWSARADAVKDAFLHAYRGYQEYAATADELLPLTDEPTNNFNGWGVTLVDGLDTMWIMDLRHEFYDTMPIFAKMNFYLDQDHFAPFFETVIRYLGGLLSAYALSGEPILLERADDLGRMLLPAFNTSSGLPMYAVNTVTGQTRGGWSRGTVLWSEALSCQLEYKYLAHLTKNRGYYDHVEKIMDIMRNANVTDGMFPTRWTLSDATPMNAQFSVGAFADSAHEYLLKQWLMTSKSETKARDLCQSPHHPILASDHPTPHFRPARSVQHHPALLYLTPNRQLLYVTTPPRSRRAHLPLAPRDKQLHEWAARGLAHTCWTTYADQPSGLGPDEMGMHAVPTTPENPFAGRWYEQVEKWEAEGRPGDPRPRRGGDRDYTTRKAAYYLRPETVESFYIMWRTTGDERWRERGWAVFEAIEREAKTPSGYASLESVESSPARKKNEMPRLKYLYLLFTDVELIPLDRWVFNTEAHPLPVFQWTDKEKKQYDIY
ncbi:glycoside hydrolase [Amylocystis lapponica]|nr:glycoside hydrolase [Amylocystis lapponica]